MKGPLISILSWLLVFGLASEVNGTTPLRCLMYLTGQHQKMPPPEKARQTSHVAIAFLPSSLFNNDSVTKWPLFTTTNDVRAQLMPDAKVIVAIGGWGDTEGFSNAARTAESRERFARNVARMVQATGADGVDIDWEYPGGNGEDYKRIPNGQKAWEVDAYPLLLTAIRSALGPKRIISAAVPGRLEDMIAFTRKTVPRIMNSVDFLNVMTYDLMNRRDNVTKHHTGIENSLAAIDAYVAAGAAPQRLHLGLAFYAKWFKTEHDACKRGNPVGCPTLLMEDPETGNDLGRSGAFSWHDEVPEDLLPSLTKAKDQGTYDTKQGGYYYWDEEEDLWWTFDPPTAITRKFPSIVINRRLGGVFAWGIGEDGPIFEHLEAVNKGLEDFDRALRSSRTDRNEL